MIKAMSGVLKLLQRAFSNRLIRNIGSLEPNYQWVWEVGGNQKTWQKPTWMQGEHSHTVTRAQDGGRNQGLPACSAQLVKCK